MNPLGLFSSDEPEPEPVAADLDLDTVFGVVENRRRRLVIDYVATNLGPEESVTIRTLGEYIAALETGCEIDEASRPEYKAVYVALWQTHLEALVDCGAIERPAEHEVVAGPNLEAVHTILEAGETATGGEI